ncbi:MAG TPA: hypothetical protein PKE03_05605 [Bacteroidales bacterium]|nr:hypothetical protein [Bacteroidales bacterium]
MGKRINKPALLNSAAACLMFGWGLVHSADVRAQNTREQVTIIGTFQPSIKEANKIIQLPELSGNPMPTGNQRLSRVETTVEVKIDPEAISPLQTEVGEAKNLYRNHLNLGFGSNLNPIFDFLHYSALSKTVGLNVRASHRSSWSNVRDYAPSTWMKNEAAVATNINLNEQTIQAELSYGFDQFHHYGFKPADFPTYDGVSKNLMQHFSLITADARWQTKFRDPESVNHRIGLNLNFLSDRYGTFEHTFALSGGASKNMNWFSFDGTQYAMIDANLSYVAEGDSIMEKSTLLIHARPAVGLKGSFYALEAGLGLSSAQAEKSYFHLLPELSANLYVFQDRMSIFASFGGRLEHNSRRSLMAVNPYLRSIDSSFMTVLPVVFQAGIKGNPLEGLELRFSYEHMTAEHMGFFVLDSTSLYKHLYTTAFDDVTRNRFSAEMRYDMSNGARAEIIAHLDQYEMTSLDEPWHMPALQINLNSRYPLTDKLQATAGMLLLSKRYAPATNGQSRKLKDVTDISLGAEYQHNQQLWFYARAGNLLNQRYHRFDSYPVQGAQLVAGMKLNF